MKCLLKRKGAISVFLLIIFMVTYVFTGLLVDAGRYRMAETYLESALDNAGSSILASYNRLLFDLYGLFSTDIEAKDEAEMEGEIKALYEHYLKETLGLIETDVSAYNSALVDAIFPQEKATIDTGDLYDFTVTELNAGSAITLADTANIENQIIEYMKFRAPVQLVGEVDGFLGKINEILNMKKRIEESLTKAKIKQKYEEPGNGGQSLSEEAQQLLQDINAIAAVLYYYSIEPQIGYDTLRSRSKPSKEEIASLQYYSLWEPIPKFDEGLKKADKDFQTAFALEIEQFRTSIQSIINDLKKEIGNGSGKYEVKLESSYLKAGTNSQTPYFSEIDETEWRERAIEVAEDVYAELTRRYEEEKNQEGWEEWDKFTKFREDYKEERKAHEETVEGIQRRRKEAYEAEKTSLKTSLVNIESSAALLHEDLNVLRDRINITVGRYEAYIKELEAQQNKAPNDPNKKTVYAPDIELAKANAAEIIKNLELLMNSRQYLLDLGKDHSTAGYLSSSLGKAAEEFIKDRNQSAAGIKNKADLDQWMISSYLENMINKADWLASAVTARERIPKAQGNIAALHSLASYFYEEHYRRDVDVITKETKIKINTEEVVSKTEEDAKKNSGNQNAGEKEDEKLSLDNEEMKKASDYLDYLTVRYSYAPSPENEESNDFAMDEKVSVDTMVKILDFGRALIATLEDLLEGARDNLYVDAYVMSLFPNYYEYNLYNQNPQNTAIQGSAFRTEYQKYNASYAEAEFIITGAGGKSKDAEGNVRVFSNKIKAPAEGGETEGFGKLSVSSMRSKLFGTRLLFNSIAMFTDSAKYSQASSLSAWAGPFAPLVTVVLMVAWAVAETAIDIIILMGENAEFSKGFGAEDGKVPIFKQGKDWYLSLEGALNNLVEAGIDLLAEAMADKGKMLTKSLEAKVNVAIYDAYTSKKTDINEILNEAKTTGELMIGNWRNGLADNMDKLQEEGNLEGFTEAREMIGNIGNTLTGKFGGIVADTQKELNFIVGSAQEQAAQIVSRAGDEIIKEADELIKKAGSKAKTFLKDNLSKIIPVGEVVNTGQKSTVKMGYRDYMYFYLFTMNSELKLQRIQAVIQANMKVGGQKGFKMETAPASVWADLECSMKYMFLSDIAVPEKIRRNGRLRLKAISAQSY